MKLTILDTGAIDLASGANGLIQENGLETAVIISLLTERRADPDDKLPDDDGRTSIISSDRRGWCGDALADQPNDRIGSRLWLLAREKQTEETRRRAIYYARESLHWIIQDKIASAIDIEAEWAEIGRLNMAITIYLVAGGSATMNLNNVLGGFYAL